MKKIVYFFAVTIFLFGATAVLAANTSAGQNNNKDQGMGVSGSAGGQVVTPQSSQGAQIQVQQQLKNQGENTVNQVQQETQTLLKVKNISELKDAISQKKQELEQELSKKTEKEQKVYKNQNQVREAVHALLASEDLTNGIGQQVSVIAQEFNNSVEKTIQAENKIQQRGWLKRLWSGGDKESAEKIANEVKLNAGKVQQLLDLKNNCTKCSAEIKAIVEEQIQKVTAEQTRLEELSKAEKKAAGVWGWFKGLFGAK